MINELMVERIIDLLCNMLNINISWDYTINNNELPKEVTAVFLKPEEIKLYSNGLINEPFIIINKDYNSNDTELIFISSIAHECFHAWQWFNRKKKIIYEQEFNDGFNMRGKDWFNCPEYLNRQIELEAYVFQNEFLHFITNDNSIAIEVIKYLDQDKMKEAKKWIDSIIDDFKRKH